MPINDLTFRTKQVLRKLAINGNLKVGWEHEMTKELEECIKKVEGDKQKEAKAKKEAEAKKEEAKQQYVTERVDMKIKNLASEDTSGFASLFYLILFG